MRENGDDTPQALHMLKQKKITVKDFTPDVFSDLEN